MVASTSVDTSIGVVGIEATADGIRRVRLPGGAELEHRGDGAAAETAASAASQLEEYARGEREDFELELDWKIGSAGNSGVFYRGTDEFNQIYWSAPEYQLLDNVNAADNKKDNHLAGSVYDMFDVPKDAAKPAND